ncbi:MAG: hypothetical protein ACJAQT_000510 [Akkermansiaceae bacterium]|jgi:hypothetical protein
MFEMKNSAGSRKPNLGVFHVSCWVLGLVGFVQMMAVGVAMAFRNQRMPEPDERIVKEYVMVPAESRAPVTVVTPPKVKRAPIVMADDEDLIPDLGAVAEFSGDEVLNSPPPVLDPVVEELLKGARDARIQGDHALAHSKLSEAQLKAPEDPNVLYGLGVNFEDLGITDKATVYYKAIYKAGPEVAGSLFEKAAIRLAHGLVPNVKDLAKLGWGRMTTPSRVDGGEKRTMILPVHVSPTKNFDPMLFKPRVRFYEEVNGKISQAVIKNGDSGSDWVTGAADWKDGEEMAEVWYFVPDQDAARSLLFGERAFYGFVAELYYDGRLVDIIGQPRTLLREDGGQSTMQELQREFDELDGLELEDLIPAGRSLLPGK